MLSPFAGKTKKHCIFSASLTQQTTFLLHHYKTHLPFSVFNSFIQVVIEVGEVALKLMDISMDSSVTGKVKKIIWKRSQSPMDVDGGIEEQDNCKDAGDETPQCDSLQLVTYPRTCHSAQPFALPLMPVLKVDEWCSNTSVVLTGTACRGGTGPPIGIADIGESKSAYYFCIALPGVKKDPGEFSCEIQRDGKICIRGVTSTGGNIVQKYSRVYEMKFQQQSPPGPFTLFFSLPGPVDPRLFAPHFRPDGIFEGVVAKY